MPLSEYPIISITDEMVRADEQMGSKDKFWIELPARLGGGEWLFKEPRTRVGNMEHLAEKVACELAELLGLPIARVELAEFKERRGTVSKSVLGAGEALVHGNEILAGRVDGYDRKAKRRTSNHTFERIQKGIMEICAERYEEELRQFMGYLTLDALIGNTDRHHENWAVLRRDYPQPIAYRLAPSFDHASSLGREMRDERRLLLLGEGRVEQYLRDGQGAIYLADGGTAPLAPLTLVEKLFPTCPFRFRPWLQKLGRVTEESVTSILNRLPADWATQAQCDFARALILEAKTVLARLK